MRPFGIGLPDRDGDRELAELRASGAAFDDLAAQVIDEEGDELRKMVSHLGANGTVAFARPRGRASATIERRRLRAPVLKTDAARVDGTSTSGCGLLSKDESDNQGEYFLQLAILSAWLRSTDED